MQDEVEAEVEEEDVVAAEEEGVLGDNVFQDYFQSDMELGDIFCTGFVCQFLINLSVG